MVARSVLPLEFEDIDERRETKSEADPVLVVDDANQTDALAELEERLCLQAEKNSQEIERARESARLDARVELENEFEEKVAGERELIAAACERFARERTKYFAEVESEVVRLALAVAARVLHREACLDPLLLRGVVRVALEQLHENSMAKLRVPESQVDAWSRVITKDREGVVVTADPGVVEGDCVLETSVGRVELGVKAQMEEIEKGFFDLLRQRPA